jgi:hypothetical protein
MTPEQRKRLEDNHARQRAIHEALYAAQKVAIGSLRASIDALDTMHDEMYKLFKSLNEGDDALKDAE